MRKIRVIVIPIILTATFIIGFNSYIKKMYYEEIEKRDISSIKHQYNNIIRDRGGMIKEDIFNDNDLILLGSSELSSKLKQNAVNMFPFKGAEYDVSIFGRAHTQNLQHSSMLGSTADISADEKVVIIESLQWFENPSGIEGREFKVNFSEYQFYKMLNNPKISSGNKVYYANRIKEILGETEEFVEERIYATLYSNEDIISKVFLYLSKPYFKLKEYMLENRDLYQSYKAIKDLPNKENTTNTNEIDWDKEYKSAEEEGASRVSNNDIYVDDEYFDTYLREYYDSLKDKSKDINLLISKEFEDFKFFLDVSNELGIKPVVIMMPVNGRYYDYLGLTAEKRNEFYLEMERIANEKGVEIINLQKHEYEKYYMFDVMHLGWKGWLNVNEELYKQFK